MAAKRKDDDGPITGVQAFAGELRAQREAAGLTQAQLAKLMGYSESVVAKLETCRTIPSPQHAAQADEALRTPGTFRRLRQAMLNRSYESWVRALLEMEDRATVLRWWEPLVVPGLLQTEAYARAMIRAGRPGDSDAEVEQMVIARISRQAIWDRKDPPPPMLFAVLGEAILRQRVGDAQIMRDQLGHLAEMAGNPGSPSRCCRSARRRTRGCWARSWWPASTATGTPPIWTTPWTGRSPNGVIRLRGSRFFMIHSGAWRSHLGRPRN